MNRQMDRWSDGWNMERQSLYDMLSFQVTDKLDSNKGITMSVSESITDKQTDGQMVQWMENRELHSLYDILSCQAIDKLNLNKGTTIFVPQRIRVPHFEQFLLYPQCFFLSCRGVKSGLYQGKCLFIACQVTYLGERRNNSTTFTNIQQVCNRQL